MQEAAETKKFLDSCIAPSLGRGKSATVPPAGKVSEAAVQFDIGQLPIELVERIVACLDSGADLFNVCLVCKQFRDLATPHLYESVSLSSAEQIVNFSSTLSQHPGLGCKVRHLWMFLSVIRYRERPRIPEQDEDSDDSEWTPSDDDEPSSDFTSDGSDSEKNHEDEYPEVNDVDIPVHLPSGLVYPHQRTLMDSHTSVSQSGHSRIPHHHEHPDRNLWMDCLCPIITSESAVYAHAYAVLDVCISLRTLYLLWSRDFRPLFMRALLPRTQLQELAVYQGDDLRLVNDNSEFDPINTYGSSIQRLTILNTGFERKIPKELPEMFPVLTHLRISLHVVADMADWLARFPRLTHLWFAPPLGNWHPKANTEAFLLELQKKCHSIKRVRIDIPLGFEDVLQAADVASLEQFSFVRVRNSVLGDIGKMWVYDLGAPFLRQPRGVGASMDMFNAYAKGLKHYWTLRLEGGGWDE